MTNTDRLAARMARAEVAFTKHVIEGKSLRDLAPEIGVSRETARQDVIAYQKLLAQDRADDLNERRAIFEAQLAAVQSRMMELFEKYKKTKPLAAVAAMNTYVATLTHQRAVQGLDAPRETKVEQSGEVRIVWDDGTAPTDPGYGEVGLVPMARG